MLISVASNTKCLRVRRAFFTTKTSPSSFKTKDEIARGCMRSQRSCTLTALKRAMRCCELGFICCGNLTYLFFFQSSLVNARLLAMELKDALVVHGFPLLRSTWAKTLLRVKEPTYIYEDPDSFVRLIILLFLIFLEIKKNIYLN